MAVTTTHGTIVVVVLALFSGAETGVYGSDAVVIDLSDETWSLENANGSIRVNDVTVPGNMYTAMMKEGLIDDPYYRFNDVTYRWVHWDNWTYTTLVNVNHNIASKKAVILVCEGLDTIATVFVNDLEVGQSNNQFVRYVYNVKDALTVGANEVKIAFTSAPHYALDQYNNHSYRIPPDCPPPDYHPECHANFIRKAQCSFSWDWGPAFATQGIWQGIQFQGFDAAVIRDVVFSMNQSDAGDWLVGLVVYLDLAVEELTGKMEVSLPEVDLNVTIDVTVTKDIQSYITYVLGVPRDKVEPWAPRGYGNPRLYDLKVVLYNLLDEEIARKSSKTGFRKVELVQETVNNGLSFFFKVNDVPIYMKGTNWIPADSFLDRVTPQRLRELLQSAVDSNMNSVRIWGGGIYEPDEFYDLADELGLLVWQDMMFACSMYPTDAAFIQTVADEIQHQVRRLSRHPSIVAWTANNENEGALVDNWYGTWGQLYPRYKQDYVQLYIDTVRAGLLADNSTTPFISSSPTNGLVSEQSGWISELPRPSSPRYGDVHYYNYVDDCWDPSIYPRARYASEYGYQSWPSLQTISRVSVQTDWAYASDFFKHRQHHAGGGNGTDQMIRRHFIWPDSGDPINDFQNYIFLTQISQALCYRVETEFYRRSRSDVDIQNMGALYWQLNDIWQAPSWATIDFDGNWKMAQYYATWFFADFIVSTYEEAGSLRVYAVADHLPAGPTPVDLLIELWSWTDPPDTPSHTFTFSGQVSEIGSSQLFDNSTSELLQSGGCTNRSMCFLVLYLHEQGLASPITPKSAFYLDSFKNDKALVKPNLKINSVTSIPGNLYEIDISTDHVAAFVWLEAADIRGRFSDNGFVMTSATKVVTFYPWQETSEEALSRALFITSLNDVYTAHSVSGAPQLHRRPSEPIALCLLLLISAHYLRK